MYIPNIFRAITIIYPENDDPLSLPGELQWYLQTLGKACNTTGTAQTSLFLDDIDSGKTIPTTLVAQVSTTVFQVEVANLTSNRKNLVLLLFKHSKIHIYG